MDNGVTWRLIRPYYLTSALGMATGMILGGLLIVLHYWGVIQ